MTATQPTSGTVPVPAQAAGQALVGTAVAERRPPNRWYRPKRLVGKVLLWIALAAFSMLFLYPFVWLLSASFKPRGEVFDNKLIPDTVLPGNYVEVFDQLPLLSWMGNSVLIAVLAALFVAISSSAVAFGFAAAMAWLLFVIIMIITFVQMRFGNRFVYYEGDRD